MTTGYFMVVVAGVLPLLCALFAKLTKGFDNHAPRPWLENIPNNHWRKRLVWAQANSWEAFALFAPAVIIAHLSHAKPAHVSLLATGFIALRIAYIICYAYDRATVRSLCWLGGVMCTFGLYFLA